MTATLFLVSGLLIYVVWRPQGIFGGLLTSLSCKIGAPSIPEWIVGSAPDALWYAALLCLQPRIQDVKKSGIRKVLWITAIILPFCHELMQWVGIVHGTFSMADLGIYFLVLIIYILVI